MGTFQVLLLFSEKCLLPQCRSPWLCFPAWVYPFMTLLMKPGAETQILEPVQKAGGLGHQPTRNLEVGHKTGLVAFRSWTSEFT